MNKENQHKEALPCGVFFNDGISLYNGDCLEVMDYLISQDVTVDAIITDPPYGTTACKWDGVIPFDEMWLRLNKLIKPNGAIVLFGSEPFSSYLRMSNIKNYKYDWKWNKTIGGSPLVAKYRPMGIFEDIMIFTLKGRVNYYPIMEEAKKENIRPLKSSKQKTNLMNNIKGGEFKPKFDYNPNKRYPKNELIFPSRNKECNSLNRVHPTQKPVAVMEYLIKTYTNEGEIVLDFTMGSGSTILAAKNLNRRGIGIELDENYFNIAKERIINDK